MAESSLWKVLGKTETTCEIILLSGFPLLHPRGSLMLGETVACAAISPHCIMIIMMTILSTFIRG